MNLFLLPYHPRSDSVLLWLGHLSVKGVLPHQTPAGTTVRLDGPDLSRRYGIGGWRIVGEGSLRFRYCVLEIEGLPPDTHFEARVLLPDGDTATSCRFDTLPAGLPSSKDVRAGTTRPFVMSLGSCFWVNGPSSQTISGRYARLYDDPMKRPHVSLFVGDQVYLDQPPAEFLIKKTTEGLSNFLVNRYSDSWEALRDVLRLGANVCIADDHDFWNDFPNPPREAWPALRASSRYRDTMTRQAKALLRQVQRGRNIDEFDIGADLAVFIADTRVNRREGVDSFMADSDLDRLCTWLETFGVPVSLSLVRLSSGHRWDWSTQMHTFRGGQ